MIKKILLVILPLIGTIQPAHADEIGKSDKFKLPGSLKYVDTDNDDIVSLEEAVVIFDQYLTNQTKDLNNDLVQDVECAVIDLISYLEGVSCNDIKKTAAAKRFIEVYYVNKFNSLTTIPFGMGDSPGDVKPDSADIPMPSAPTEKEQTSLFDKYFSVGAQVTAVYQDPRGYKKPVVDDPTGITWNKETLVMATIPIDVKPWIGALFNVTPEYAGGSGVGNGAGFAGYPNALFGFPQAYPYLLRAQYQQEFVIDTNQQDGLKNFQFLMGKFILQEAFDANPYAGDPKKDFLNFNHTMLSAWDAATTAYGYTYGGAIRFNFRTCQLNFAAVTVNKSAGGTEPDWNVKQAQSYNLQFAQKFQLGSKTGTLRFLSFYNRTFSGSFSNFAKDSITNAAYFSDSLKAYRGKYGFGFDMDLALTENLGFFARYSWNDGKTESMGYTQADQSINAGFVYTLGKYKRSNDMFGISASVNDLSKGHRNFLAYGGTGFMIGDGSLNYKSEMVAEMFYRTNIVKYVDVSFNYQYIMNSAYNMDRGNIHFLGCRLNFEF